jgi:hypothetical protein
MEKVGKFTITGPDDHLEVLKKLCNDASIDSFEGKVSTLSRVTIPVRKREEAGVPEDAHFFAFVYPITEIAKRLRAFSVDEDSEWAFLLRIGGYCYFDEHMNVKRVNALGLVLSDVTLHLEGPYHADHQAAAALVDQGRMEPVTLRVMEMAGFTKFGWVHSNEQIGGHKLGAKAYPTGAFMYEKVRLDLT